MEPVVLFFLCSRAKANSLCAILTEPILTPKSGMTFLLFLTHHLLFFSAHIVRWITENNRPANVVNDRELRELLTAGRPNIVLPGPITVTRDIKACFDTCRDRIAKLLHVCFCLHFILGSGLILIFRNIQGGCTLQRMHGHRRTIGPLWHGPYISSTKVKCLLSSLTSLKWRRQVGSLIFFASDAN
jgi:hypothetical protein